METSFMILLCGDSKLATAYVFFLIIVLISHIFLAVYISFHVTDLKIFAGKKYEYNIIVLFFAFGYQIMFTYYIGNVWINDLYYNEVL